MMTLIFKMYIFHLPQISYEKETVEIKTLDILKYFNLY